MSKYEGRKPGALKITKWIFTKDNYVDALVLGNIKNSESILVGSKAMNMQVGGLYSKQTDDIDIIAKNAFKQAKRLESQIDNDFQADMVDVKKGKHKGTARVFANYGVRDVADFTKPTRKIRTVKIRGVKVQSLSDIIKDREKILKDPKSAYRHEKDRRTIAKIKAYQRSRIPLGYLKRLRL